jgi:Fur family peroxide stress response transcriptional regulator
MNLVIALQNCNLKVTPQRLEIVNILYKYGHLNVDTLYKLLQVKFPTLSLATIYKNINTMTNKMFISEVKIPNKKNVYELTKEEHSHILCTKCDDIIDIKINTQNIYTQAKIKSKYILNSNSIILSGLCPNCQNK